MKYNKGFAPLVVLLIVLGVLAVGGVAYFAGKSSTPKNEVADNSNYFPTTEQNYTPPTTTNNNPPAQTPPPSNNPPPQTLPPQPSNTATYSGNGFSVQYPKSISGTNIFVKESNDTTLNAKEITFTLGDGINSESSLRYYVFVKDGISATGLDNYIRTSILPRHPGGNNVFSAKSFTLGGKQGMQYTYEGCCDAGIIENGVKTGYTTAVSDGSKVYILELHAATKTEYTSFLSSFKFTNSQTSNNNQPYEHGDDQNGQHIGYIKSVSSPSGNYSLNIDYIQWITPCVANPTTSYCMNGYEVVNSNPLIRTFPISSSAVIKMQTWSHDVNGNFNYNEIVSLSLFKGIINGTSIPPSYTDMGSGANPYTGWYNTGTTTVRGIPFWITLSGGIITNITEQYIP